MQTLSPVGSGSFDTLGRFWGWWRDELSASVPAALMAKRARGRACDIDLFLKPDGSLTLRGRKGAEVVLAADEGLAGALAAMTDDAKVSALRLDVPRVQCLVRHVALPRRALRSASRLLSRELADTTPLRPEEVFEDWYVEAEDPVTGTLAVKHVVLSRARVAPLLDAAVQAGLAVRSMTVGTGEGRPLPVDLLSASAPGFRAFLSGLSLSAKALWGAALVLAVSLPFLALHRAEATLGELAQARTEAVARSAAGPKLAGPALAFLGEAAARPQLEVLLDEVGRLLPSGAYLSRLSLNAGRLELFVAGPDAGAAAAALAASPLMALVSDESANDGRRLVLAAGVKPQVAP